MEMLRGDKPVVQICRERGIKDTLLYKWRDAFLERGPRVFEDKRSNKSGNEEAERIAELERLVGRLTLEVEILKKAKSWLSERRQSNGS
jgi:transposase-like protein